MSNPPHDRDMDAAVQSGTRSWIHYDPERVDYAVSGEELEKIASSSQNNWKDFAIGCFAVAIPCLVNAVSADPWKEDFKITLSFNLNVICAVLGLVLGLAFLIAWCKTRSKVGQLIDNIRSKPKMEFTPKLTSIGKMGT